MVRTFQAWSLAQDGLKPGNAEFGPWGKGGSLETWSWSEAEGGPASTGLAPVASAGPA